MHEMSIVAELMAQLEAVATENGLTQIDEVFVTAGAMRSIVPEAFAFAFELLSADTCAAGAKIKLEIVQPKARCRRCERTFAVGIDSFLCPDCNQADVELIEGNDIILTSVTGQKPEGDDGDED